MRTALSDDTLYLDDRGRVFCGRHIDRPLRKREADFQDFFEFEGDGTLACETCGELGGWER